MIRRDAKVIQICGTGSGVGKSVVVAGLCRILRQEGFNVAPFKAQNMALNSAVTPDGLEIGRAQAMQAQACKIAPSVDMNPVLLKPTSNVGSQVIVHGRPIGNMSAVEYYKYKPKVFSKVKESIKRLMGEHEIVIIEGAGSPAEINLKKHDIVNMKIASFLNAPVLLVGDIDCGGVFAWLLGTLLLLTEKEKSLVKGFIINKFRGDISLLKSGLSFLERKSAKKVLGVIPYYTNILLPQEDSLFFNKLSKKKRLGNKILDIAVVRLPHISNFTDFDVFGHESGVEINFTIDQKEINKADCIILPGTKNTISDLSFLFEKGLAALIQRQAHKGVMVVGICGGFQMLGECVNDAASVESNRGKRKGLGLLDVRTQFQKSKKTFLVEATHIETLVPIQGYEIHHGHTKLDSNTAALFVIKKRGKKNVYVKDGAKNKTGSVWGTYIHGVFDNNDFRMKFLNDLRRQKGIAQIKKIRSFSYEAEFDKLADHLREHLDINRIKKIILNNKQ